MNEQNTYGTVGYEEFLTNRDEIISKFKIAIKREAVRICLHKGR